MGFTFRYESLLSYRRHLKEKAEIELGKAQADRSRARQLLAECEKNLQEGGKSLDLGLASRMTSGEMATHSDYLAGLRKKIGAQKLNVGRWEKIVAEKRKALLAKTREHRIFEKLKERDAEKWNHQQSLLERKRMNEVAVVRHGREFL